MPLFQPARRAHPGGRSSRQRREGRLLIKPFEFDQFQAKLDAFAARADALKSAARADQSLIDAPFGGNAAAPAAAESLPKGLGVETGRLVLDAVRSAGYRVA